MGCSAREIWRICRIDSTRGTFIDHWVPGPGRLTLANREEICLGLERGETFTLIAEHLGKAVSTVSREVKVNEGREDYRTEGPDSASENLPLCVQLPGTPSCSLHVVTTHAGLTNSDPASPADYLAAITAWVDHRLACP